MWGLSEWYPTKAKETGDLPPRKAQPKQRTKRPAKKKAGVAKPTAQNKPAAKPADAKATTAAPAAAAEAAPKNGAGPSTSELIREVLRASGKPLHAKAITEQVNARGKAATRSTIEGFLVHWAKDGKVKRTAPSTFSL